jgi:Ca2+-binding RTX toxin-like protein
VLLAGGDDDDTITGSKYADNVDGGSGNDTISVNDGDDTNVKGGAGNDSLDGGHGNDYLRGEDGVDTCYGGNGNDVCDGGSPGPVENTPSDADTCAPDIETRISCRDSVLPQRWIASFNGTSTYAPAPGAHEETTTWSFSVTIEAFNEYHGKVDFREVVGSGTGSYSTEGFNDDCTIEGSGTYDDAETSVGLTIDPASEAYDWDWIGLYRAETVWHCPDATYDNRFAPVNAKEMVDGLLYNPDGSGTLTGHRTITADNFMTHDYSWTLTPAP